jgi:hypothetical protein
MSKITKKEINAAITSRSLNGVYPKYNPMDREWKCVINGDTYISDNRRQTCRDDGVEQGTILKNGEPLKGVYGWTKENMTDSLYRHLNGLEQWKDPNGL